MGMADASGNETWDGGAVGSLLVVGVYHAEHQPVVVSGGDVIEGTCWCSLLSTLLSTACQPLPDVHRCFCYQCYAFSFPSSLIV